MTSPAQNLTPDEKALLAKILSVEEPTQPPSMDYRRWVFCRCYLKTNNATQSAKLAGYSGKPSTLAATACRVKRSDEVRKFLEGSHEKAMEKGSSHLTLDEILTRVAEVTRGGITSPTELKGLEMSLRYQIEKLKDGDQQKPVVELLDALCVHAPTESPAAFALKVACAVERAAITFAEGWPQTEALRNWRPPADALEELEQSPGLIEFLTENGCGNYLRELTAETGQRDAARTPANGRAGT